GRIVFWNNEQTGIRFRPSYVCDLILDSAGTRIHAPGVNHNLELRGVPSLVDHFNWSVVANRANGNGDTSSDRVHAGNASTAERFFLRPVLLALRCCRDRHRETKTQAHTSDSLKHSYRRCSFGRTHVP